MQFALSAFEVLEMALLHVWKSLQDAYDLLDRLFPRSHPIPHVKRERKPFRYLATISFPVSRDAHVRLRLQYTAPPPRRQKCVR